MKPHCQKPLPFASLEVALESISTLIASDYRDNVYALLWEIGTNALKYGLKDLYAPVLYANNDGSSPLALPENTLYITTRIAMDHALYTTFYYPVAIATFSTTATPSPYTCPLSLLAKSTPPLESTHHHNLGHKLIGRYAEIFCYNMPKFTIISAKYRAISIIIKGQYLAI